MPAPFDIAEGVRGIEALWTLDGTFALNDRDDDAYFDLGKISGLFSGADHEDPRAKKVGRPGENFYPTSAAGKTVVLEGQLRATTLPGMRTFGTALRGVLAELRREIAVDIAPHPDIGGAAARFYCRALQHDLDDVQEVIAWRRRGPIGLRLSDPRVYFPSLAVDVVGSPAAVTNVGSAPVDPVLTLAGADGDVTVTDGTHTLSFRTGGSGTLVVDFAARTAKLGANNVELVVADSDWWDSFVDGIAPGASVSIAQAGATSVRVQFTPAAW